MGEAECKRIAEAYFQKPFVKARPDALRNPVTGENLELDLYNAELKLAIEYNGRQHYEHVPHFHGPTKEKFYNQKYRDLLKQQMCEKAGIHLITVPYSCTDISSFLKESFRNTVQL